MSRTASNLTSLCRKTLSAFVSAALILAAFIAGNPASAQTITEKRIAFVVGNAAYKTGALATPANDAGLIAQTLQAAGFDVVGARDLDQNGLHDAMRDFLAKASAAGPNAVVFVYLAGYGLQYQGDNYFAPVDAQMANATDVPVEALRISDFTKALAALNNRGSIVVLDGARSDPFVTGGEPLAGGLALVEPDANQLIAFNAMPGTVAPQENGPYGAYAHALAETIRTGGLSLADVFDRTRLRVGELSKGAEISWDADKFKTPFTFFNRAANAPVADTPTYDAVSISKKPIREFDERDAYFAALYRDTLAGYEDFLAAYPDDAMARRVRAIVAARREAITWRETWLTDTPQAYWSYLRRYPHGPHMWDARRRLAHLEAALEPPPSFTVIEYDVPPPPPTEIVYVERRVLYFDDTDFGYAPPPPVVFLAPPQRDFVVLPPPPPPVSLYVLPTPAFVPVPAWVEAPAYVEPPQNNIIFNNIHNTVVNNTIINNPAQPAEGQAPQGLTTGQKLAGAALAAGAGAAALHVALPPSLQKKAMHMQGQTPPSAPLQGMAAPVANTKAPAQTPADNHALPGANGQPLPAAGVAPLIKANPANKLPPTGTPQAEPTAGLQKNETNSHALPGANGKALPPIGNMPPLKGADVLKPAAQQPQAPAQSALPGVQKPKPDTRAKLNTLDAPAPMQAAKPKQDHNRPLPGNAPVIRDAQPKHQPKPQAAMQPKPQPQFKAPKQEAKPPHMSEPKPPKPPKAPKLPKPEKPKKCHGEAGCR